MMTPIWVIPRGAVKVGDIARLALGLGAGIERLGQPEVEDLHRPVVSNFDVRGFQIAMDDAAIVRRVERIGDLPRDRNRVGHRDRSPGDDGRQVVAVDEFHHEAVRTIDHAVDLGDIRMVQCGQGLRFAPEAHDAVGIDRHDAGEDLDGDVAIEGGVAGLVDLAHTAGAQFGQDVVGPHTAAGSQHVGVAPF